MVVMAIIAILATAGLSAYTGYLKKARDTTRLEDIRAIETVAASSLTPNGNSISLTDLKDAIEAMNNDQLLMDPLDNKDVCMTSTGATTDTCWYYYGVCDNGSYVLRVKFESASNLYRYDTANEPLISTSGEHDPGSYDLGSCDNVVFPNNGDSWWISLR